MRVFPKAARAAVLVLIMSIVAPVVLGQTYCRGYCWDDIVCDQNSPAQREIFGIMLGAQTGMDHTLYAFYNESGNQWEGMEDSDAALGSEYNGLHQGSRHRIFAFGLGTHGGEHSFNGSTTGVIVDEDWGHTEELFMDLLAICNSQGGGGGGDPPGDPLQ